MDISLAEYLKQVEDYITEYVSKNGDIQRLELPPVILTPEYWEYLNWVAQQDYPSSLEDYFNATGKGGNIYVTEGATI